MEKTAELCIIKNEFFFFFKIFDVDISFHPDIKLISDSRSTI